MPTTDSRLEANEPPASWGEMPELRVEIPDHELLRRVGSGSYGDVWLARNKMGTWRAVKVVHKRRFRDNVPFDRELAGIRSFEPISRTHEGFIDILHVGIDEAEGYFYYIMELGDDKVHGQDIDWETYAPRTLASEIALQGRVSAEKCLAWGIALSSALHQLHQHGLVHRDIKPSNIIFVSGVPKLADIGLVAALREARSFVGTQGFIPPEGPGKAQADIYGLGKVLYEALTGRDRLDFPSLPRDFDELEDKTLFWELNTVVLHSCQSEVKDRYETAWNMHTDLLFLTSGKSVKRLKELERLFRKAKTAGLTILPFALVAGAGLFLASREVTHRAELRQRDVGMDLAYGNSSMNVGDLLGALPYYVRVLQLEKADRVQQDNNRLRIGSILSLTPRLTHLWTNEMELHSCEFSGDGNRLLVSPWKGQTRIYDLSTDKQIDAALGSAGGFPIATFNRDGKFVAIPNSSRIVAIWNAHRFLQITNLIHRTNVHSARFSPDGTRIITAADDGVARVWNWTANRLELQLTGHNGPLRFAGFSPDGKLIVTTGQDGTARIWDAQTGRELRLLPHGMWVSSAAFSPDGKKLVTACDDHKARVWDVQTGERIRPDLNHRDVVSSAEFSPDNRLILTASLDGTVGLWLADSQTPASPAPVLRFPDRVRQATFSPDSRVIAVVCCDGSIWTWDLAGVETPVCTDRKIFNRDGSRCITFGNNTVRISDAPFGQTATREVRTDSPIETAGFNSDGSLVYVVERIHAPDGSIKQQIQLRNCSSGQPAAPVLTETNAFGDLAVNNAGTKCLIWSTNGVQLVDIPSGTRSGLGFIPRGEAATCFFALSNRIFVVAAGKTVRICDAETGEPISAPLAHDYPVRWAVLSPDESRVLTGCADPYLTKCYAQFWNAQTGTAIGDRLRHGDGVLAGAFSSDGKKVVTAAEDFTAIVWDAQTGKQLTSLLEHADQVAKAAFVPDGRRVATASFDRTSRVWDAQTGAPLTPYLPHISGLRDVGFVGGNLITSDRPARGGEGHSWLWVLQADNRPVEDLSKVARLLTAGVVSPAAPHRRFASESFQADWDFLRSKYMAGFSVTTNEVLAWHEYQAQTAETRSNWFTAVFHLERLVRLESAGANLLHRREVANSRLNEGTSSEGSE